MTSAQLYLPTVLPQWGIFAGVVLITIGYVEKKDLWTRLGWIVLIATGLTALFFNLFTLPEKDKSGSMISILISTGWQTAAGGVLAFISMFMFQYKKKRYPILAILTLVYFVLTFFLYYQVSAISGKEIKTGRQTEQKQ